MNRDSSSALSADDWARIAQYRAAGDTEALWRMARTFLTAESPAACMAVVNALMDDGDPKKITREDADLTREIADNSGAWTDANRERLLLLGAKLSALVPRQPSDG